MHLHHIVVATDESDAGRHAVRWGLALGISAGARVTILRAVPVTSVPATIGAGPVAVGAVEESMELERLSRWLEAELRSAPVDLEVEIEVTYGVPGVEISRFAESRRADLLVLGRKARSQVTRLLVGDTADSVARRSLVPCAFVPAGARPVERVLAALDGSERGALVADAALALGRATGAWVRFITVEPGAVGDAVEPANVVPLSRTERIQQQIADRVKRAGSGSSPQGTQLLVQRGPVVTRILEALEATKAELLVVGYRRGGPAGVIEAGGIARQLLHTAPTVVMTIPI